MFIKGNVATLLKDANYVEKFDTYGWDFGVYRRSEDEKWCGTTACFVGTLPDYTSYQTELKFKRKYDISIREYIYLFIPKEVGGEVGGYGRQMTRYSLTKQASKEQVIARVRKFAAWKLKRAHKIKQYYYERFNHARNGEAIANAEWIEPNVAVV